MRKKMIQTIAVVLISNFNISCSQSLYKKKIGGKYAVSKEMALAQLEVGTAAVEGQIVDIKTGLPLQYANIFIENTKLGTSTDSLGRYYLIMPEGKYKITAKHAGNSEIHTKGINFHSKGKIIINFQLGTTWLY